MSPLLEQLKATASSLAASERAELPHYLLETLEPADEGVSEAWRAELARRMADIRSGQVADKPVEQVLARVREL